MLSINVPSIYKLSNEAPAPGAGRAGGPAALAAGRALYDQKCATCHGADRTGSGNYPSLVDITARMGPESLREAITGGRPGMPPFNDLSQSELDSLLAFLANPNAAPGGRGAGPVPRSRSGGPVVATGGAQAGRVGTAGACGRNGWPRISSGSQRAGSAHVHRVRHGWHYRQAPVFDAYRLRSQHRQDQVAGSRGRR